MHVIAFGRRLFRNMQFARRDLFLSVQLRENYFSNRKHSSEAPFANSEFRRHSAAQSLVGAPRELTDACLFAQRVTPANAMNGKARDMDAHLRWDVFSRISQRKREFRELARNLINSENKLSSFIKVAFGNIKFFLPFHFI